MDMIELDGSHGGGQLLRTALTLSLCTGTGFTLGGIRAGRPKPGLMRQHLTAVNAAAQVGSARVVGAELGAATLRFEPGAIVAGDYAFATGSAGSTTLVLQTLLPALARAPAPSSLRLEGGTHNPMAPTADFIADTWLPRLREIGYVATVKLERPGFYPAGGGILHAQIDPTPALAYCSFDERGEAHGLAATALLSGLSSGIGRRELAVLAERLGLGEESLNLHSVRPANGPGNVLQVQARFARHTATFTGHGARGVSAETVAHNLADEVDAYLQSGACIDTHLSDQLLLPMALAGGGSFTTTAASEHLRSNAALIEKFLPVEISCEEMSPSCWRVSISL
jgi:RNA 3'-terminal phosphate cyclase (ATP)